MTSLHYNEGDTLLGRTVHYEGSVPDFDLDTWVFFLRCACTSSAAHVPGVQPAGFCDHSMDSDGVLAYSEEYWFETPALAAAEGF
jgi:hypothetical protein